MPTTALDARVAQILWARYEYLGMKQRTIAEAIGVSQSQVSKLLRGDRPLEVSQFVAMCDRLGLPPVEVLREALGRD